MLELPNVRMHAELFQYCTFRSQQVSLSATMLESLTKLAYSGPCGKTEKKLREKKIRREGGRGSHFGQSSQMWERCPVTQLNDAGFCSSFNLACTLSPTSLSLNPNTARWSACVCWQSYTPPITVCALFPFLLSIHFSCILSSASFKWRQMSVWKESK